MEQLQFGCEHRDTLRGLAIALGQGATDGALFAELPLLRPYLIQEDLEFRRCGPRTLGHDLVDGRLQALLALSGEEVGVVAVGDVDL
jgi:hypothetical protein